MPTKKQIITIAVLCVIALGLGYWYGMPEKGSQKANKPGLPKVEPKPLFGSNNKDNVKIEAAIRESLGKPTGELTKVDLAKVRGLNRAGTQITDAGLKEVGKLKNLDTLDLRLTKVT